MLKNVAELASQVDYSDFIFEKHFSLLCRLIPNIEKERLDIESVDDNNFSTKGIVYVFVIDGKIFKIGQSIGNIKSRIGSYNCGKLEYRIKGTNSTTNYFVLQSILKIGETVDVYAYFATKKKYTVFGETGEESFPSTKIIERKIIKEFIKAHGEKPIANTQN